MHPTGTPHRAESRGKIERDVRTMVEGTRCNLHQAGLDHKRWPEAARHHTMATNFANAHPLLGTTAFERRHQKPFPGRVVPFGAKVMYRPPKPERDSLPKFASHTLPGIFVGWHVDPGGEWHGDYLVYRLSDFETETSPDRLHPVRVKELVVPEDLEFPLRAVRDKAQQERLLRPHLAEDDASPPPKEVETSDVGTQTLTEAPLADGPNANQATLPKGYIDVAGRPTRRYKGTTRPPDIWPEIWQMMSPKQKREAIGVHKEKLQANAANPSSDSCTDAISSNEVSAASMVQPSTSHLHLQMQDLQSNVGAGQGHRDKLSQGQLWNAAVTLTLHPSDPRSRCKEAREAVSIERQALRDRQTWLEDTVMERSDAAAKHPDAHFASLFPIVGIKNHESPDKRDHKWKGRIVVGGHNIKTATGDWAIFTEVGSTPSTMAAARTGLAISALLPNTKVKQSDCIRAYIQSTLKGPKTFVSLPRDWWPVGWDEFKDPVCELRLALYGHPTAGDCWHDKLDTILVKHQGFDKIDGWPSVCYKAVESKGGAREVHVLIVYVDDLIMIGGPALDGIIADVRREVEMEEPSRLDKYLGCHHKIARSVDITHVQWSMSDYLRSAVSMFEAETGNKLTPAPTPFVTEVSREQFQENVAKVGALGHVAAKYLMKLLYAARMCNPNLCVPVQRLATQVNKWSAEADRRLTRLYQYVKHSADWVLTGSLSTRDLDSLILRAWPDADLCGDVWSSKSTSGFFLELSGLEGRFFPLSWGSKRQGSTSNHTQEAETVSLSSCLRSELIPTQILLQVLLGRPVPGELMEDNSATIVAIQKGYSPTLRHLARTQRIALGFLHDTLSPDSDDELDLHENEGPLSVVKAETDNQKGDFLTKELPRSAFEHKLKTLGMTPQAMASSALVASSLCS